MIKSDFKLLGHLQVMEEPLSSVYADETTGQMYLFVRIFEETECSTFVLSEVTPAIVVDYMDGKVGLKAIFSSNKSFFYTYTGKALSPVDFSPLSQESVNEKLELDGLPDVFDVQLAYRSVVLKQYLRKMF